MYQAVALVKIERDIPAQLISNESKGFFLGTYDPYFLQTEFEVIQSDLVLCRAIDDLHLKRAKSDGAAQSLSVFDVVKALRARLELRPVRNTSLIEIRVVSDQPDEAARLANAVAGAYKNYRLEQRTQASRGGIETLEERFKKQEKEIEEAQRKVSDLRERLQIPDAEVNAAGPEWPLVKASKIWSLCIEEAS